MRRKLILACLSLFPLFGTGCTYMQDRAYDFVDIVGMKFLYGGGMRVGAGIGSLKNGMYLGTGLWPINPPGPQPLGIGLIDWSWYNMDKVGFQGRSAGFWHEEGMDLLFPIEHELTAIRGNDFLEASVNEFYDIEHVDDNLSGYHRENNPSLDPLSRPVNRYHNISDIQVTAFLFIGAEANTSLIQVADFLVGWFTLDIVNDDAANRDLDLKRNGDDEDEVMESKK